MIIHGFAFWKFVKPDQERLLQVSQCSQAWFFAVCRDLKKATPPNGHDNIVFKTEDFELLLPETRLPHN